MAERDPKACDFAGFYARLGIVRLGDRVAVPDLGVRGWLVGYTEAERPEPLLQVWTDDGRSLFVRRPRVVPAP